MKKNLSILLFLDSFTILACYHCPESKSIHNSGNNYETNNESPN